MYPDATLLLVGIIILLASLISLRLGLSVAIIELILGALFGNLGVLYVESRMSLVAGFGGILLTFLAGTEIDTDLMREKFIQAFLIGFLSFLMPFIGVFLFAYFGAQWGLEASLIAGTALSTTSLAVVYSVLVESNLTGTDVGKLLMASCVVTDMATVIALTVLFIKPTVYTVVFIVVSVVVIVLAAKFSHIVFDHPQLKNKVIEPEIKYLLVLLIVFSYFANLGDGQAVLPAFLLGLFMSKHFLESSETKRVRNRLRTVAYAVITPIFFIVGGTNVSVPLILTALWLFVAFLAIKLSAKFIGVYFLAKKYIPHGSVYTTLLMSTGLTFGTISALFGLTAGYINQVQYSVLIGVVVGTAVIPTFIAQRWFMPVHSEDVVDLNGGANAT